jgi:predicted RNA binding protein YcfA (HicA-like mRNA interferase family)
VVKRDKRIEAMRRNPRHVRPDELDAVLGHAGFTAHQEGSHKTYRRAGRKLTVAQHGQFVHPHAVREALRILDEIAQEEQQ